VVAATLENLAAHRNRMVGVITHVPALAERVPVRFVVSRDQRTASISRETEGEFVSRADNTEGEFVSRADNTEGELASRADNTEGELASRADNEVS
jgi:hypothetical protein